VLQVLVDADNVPSTRLQPFLDLLSTLDAPPRITASGRPAALHRNTWPPQTALLPHRGW
jgi:hypothetical protein